MKQCDSKQSALLRTFRSVGLLLLIMLGLTLALSGCTKTVVVRAECPAYPQLPKAMQDYKPAAEKHGLPRINAETLPPIR
jgi:hypothetical protein